MTLNKPYVSPYLCFCHVFSSGHVVCPSSYFWNIQNDSCLNTYTSWMYMIRTCYPHWNNNPSSYILYSAKHCIALLILIHLSSEEPYEADITIISTSQVRKQRHSNLPKIIQWLSSGAAVQVVLYWWSSAVFFTENKNRAIFKRKSGKLSQNK